MERTKLFEYALAAKTAATIALRVSILCTGIPGCGNRGGEQLTTTDFGFNKQERHEKKKLIVALLVPCVRNKLMFKTQEVDSADTFPYVSVTTLIGVDSLG